MSIDLNSYYSFIIGESMYNARRMLPSMLIRVLIRNGVERIADNMYKDNRINVEMKAGKIFKILSIG